MIDSRTSGRKLLLVATLVAGLSVVSVLGSPADRSMVSSLNADVAGLQEPPPPKSVWKRFAEPLLRLMKPREIDPISEEVAQALTERGITAWHDAGHRGKGIKVAILDSGFRHYRKAVGSLFPHSVKTKSFRKDGRLDAKNSQHGILCAEIVHRLAPEAELLFANWEPETPTSFLDAVRWACAEGASIISCSVIMPSWSDGEGGGAIHQELRAALGERLFFASAGNTAQRHWSGKLLSNTDGWHQWAARQTDNYVRPYVEDRVSLELTSREGGFEVVVIDATRSREIRRTRTLNEDGCGNAVVRFSPESNHRYLVRVRSMNPAAKQNRSFHLTCLGGKLQHSTQEGSIPFPGDGSEVVAVGAVDDRGRRMTYSSCGPLTSGLKPDLVAIVPFPSTWRPEQPFSGTSAAAPQAAGMAAVIWGRNPDWSGSRVRAELMRFAQKVRKEHCHETGHGLVRLPALLP